MTDVREQLRVYFDEVDPPFDPSELMQDPQPVPPPRRGVVRRGVLVAAVAATVLVLVVGLPLLFFANRPQTSVEPAVTTTTDAPTSTTEPATTTTAPDQVTANPLEASAEVFSWTGDDITAWVTEEEMAAALAGLSIEYAGTELHSEVEIERSDFGEVSDRVEWTVGHEYDENHWVVSVHNGDHNSDELWLYESELKLPQGEITTGGWGVFTARGPNSDESFCISLQPPVEIFGALVQEDIYEEMISVVASMMLEELGWVG